MRDKYFNILTTEQLKDLRVNKRNFYGTWTGTRLMRIQVLEPVPGCNFRIETYILELL